MNLVTYLLEQITTGWEPVFAQERSLQRALALAFGILCGVGKRTLTRAISFHGNTQKDWSADYKVFSRSKWEPRALFNPILEQARNRGVIFDVGHGGGSFDFTMAEVAIPGGCSPDTISSDIHVFSGNSPGIPYLPNVMSKFMALGFSLEQVVTMATQTPAKIINRAPKIGTLQIGAPGDVAIMDVVEGPVTFVDTRNNKRDGKVLLKPVQTVVNGVPFGRPYQAPFAVR